MSDNTILTFGKFGPPLLAFVRSCKQLGIRCVHVEVTKSGSASIRSNAIEVVEIFPHEQLHTDSGIQVLRSLIDKHHAKALVTVAENNHFWLAEHRESFGAGCSLLSCSSETLEQLSRKSAQLALAKQANFNVLPTWYIKSVADVYRIADYTFPICLRPDHPSDVAPIFKAKVFHDREGLLCFIRSLNRIDRAIIAQSFKEWPDLKVLGVRSTAGEIIALRAFYLERKFQGVTLTLMKFDLTQELKDACQSFADKAGITGCFHFDLLYCMETKLSYFLEINIRMGGVTDKSMGFGYDQPRYLLQAFGLIEEDQKATSSHKNCVRVVNRKAIARHIVENIKGNLTELDFPVVSRSRHFLLSVRDLLLACDSVFSFKDLKGSIWFYFGYHK